MDRIDPSFLYQLGGLLKPLTAVKVTPASRVNTAISSFEIVQSIHMLLDSYGTLSTCRRCGEELVQRALEVEKWIRETPTEQWQKEDFHVDFKFNQLVDKATEFQTILLSELQTLAVYHVTQKGAYNTSDLVGGTEKVLGAVQGKVSQAVRDEIRQAGKCLAFDVPTACGFHILRATESVMHDYYLAVCKPPTKERLNSWAEYISALHKQISPDVKETVAMLQQIKDNDRNLIMHPERVLTSDDAFALFELSKGAIMAMSGRLGKKVSGKRRAKKKAPVKA